MLGGELKAVNGVSCMREKTLAQQFPFSNCFLAISAVKREPAITRHAVLARELVLIAVPLIRRGYGPHLPMMLLPLLGVLDVGQM